MAFDDGTLATARVKVLADARGMPEDVRRQTTKGLGDAGERAGSSFGKRMSLAIAAAVAVGAAVVGKKLVDGLKQSVASARDLAEVTNKVNVVFGGASKEIIKFSRQAATGLGQSRTAALNAAATFATYGKGAKLTGKDLSTFSTKLVTLSSDMASFSNTKPEEAVAAIGSALRGEFDPIERYGVLLNETTVKQQALKMGLIETTKKALSPQQRVLAVQALILKQTKDAQGDFARTSGGLANQQRILTAQMENFRAKVGNALLPVVTKFVTVLTSRLMPALNELWSKHGTQITAFLDQAAVGFGEWVDRMGSVDWADMWARGVAVIERLRPALEDLKAEGGQSLSDTLHVTGVVMKFLADHSDDLAKAIPYLIAAFIILKASQAAYQVVQIVGPFLTIAQVVANLKLAASQRALSAAMTQNTAAIVGNAASTTASTAATNTGIVARGRAVVSMVVHKVATVASTAATWLMAAATTALGAVMNVVLGPIGIVIVVIAELVAGIIYAYKHNETFRKVVDTVWKAIKVAIKAVAEWFTDKVMPSLKRAIEQGKKAFEIYWKIVQFVWRAIGDYIKLQISIVLRVFGNLRKFVMETLPEAFRKGTTAIGKAWEKIQELARKPVAFVVNSIINPLIGGYNAVAKIFGASQATKITGFAGGGRIPGAPSAVDNIMGMHMAAGGRMQPVKLATGEFVVNARSTSRNLSTLQAINEDRVGYADGGVVGGFLGKVWDGIKGAASFVANPAEGLKRVFDSVIGKVPGAGMMVGMIKSMAGKVMEGVKKFLSGGLFGGGAASFGNWPSSPGAQRGDSGVWRSIVALIRSTGPISGSFGNGYRPGDPKWHGSGRAVDWMGYNQDALANFLARKRPLELIHRTNARDYAYTRGRNMGSFSSGLMNAHRNHVHAAFAAGGQVYDNGGLWRSGTVGVNTSGRTEVVTAGKTMDDAVAALYSILDMLGRLAPAIAEGVGANLAAAGNLADRSLGSRAGLYARTT